MGVSPRHYNSTMRKRARGRNARETRKNGRKSRSLNIQVVPATQSSYFFSYDFVPSCELVLNFSIDTLSFVLLESKLKTSRTCRFGRLDAWGLNTKGCKGILEYQKLTLVKIEEKELSFSFLTSRKYEYIARIVNVMLMKRVATSRAQVSWELSISWNFTYLRLFSLKIRFGQENTLKINSILEILSKIQLCYFSHSLFVECRWNVI